MKQEYFSSSHTLLDLESMEDFIVTFIFDSPSANLKAFMLYKFAPNICVTSKASVLEDDPEKNSGAFLKFLECSYLFYLLEGCWSYLEVELC
jgi:hypothetical protein